MFKVLCLLLFYVSWANCHGYGHSNTKSAHATKGGNRHDSAMPEPNSIVILDAQKVADPIEQKNVPQEDIREENVVYQQSQSVPYGSQFGNNNSPIKLQQAPENIPNPYSRIQPIRDPEFHPYEEKPTPIKPVESVGCTNIPFVQLGNKKYYFGIVYKANFFEANQLCNYHGLRLASVDSEEDEVALKSYLKNSKDKLHYWTSGCDLSEDGKFFWLSTGKPVPKIDWKHEKVNNDGGNHCLELDNTQANIGVEWNKCNCLEKQHFICEMAPQPTPEEACESCRKYQLSLYQNKPNYNRPPSYPSRPSPYYPSQHRPYIRF